MPTSLDPAFAAAADTAVKAEPAMPTGPAVPAGETSVNVDLTDVAFLSSDEGTEGADSRRELSKQTVARRVRAEHGITKPRDYATRSKAATPGSK